MTVFVNKEAARNLYSNRAAIENITVAGKSQKDVSSTYQGFFAVRPSSTTATITATATPTCTTTASKSSPLTQKITSRENKNPQFHRCCPHNTDSVVRQANLPWRLILLQLII